LPDLPYKKILKWAGFPLFFLFCFVFFAYKTFPYEKLSDRIVQEAAAQGYEVEIVDLTHSGLTGLELENVRVVLPPEDEDSPPLDVIFDQLEIGTTLLSLLSSTKTYEFVAELGGGEVDGEVTRGEESLAVDVGIDDLTLEAVPALRRFTKVPLTGVMNGEIELSMPADVADSSGDIEVSIEGLSIGDGKTQIDIPGWGGLTLDKADAGNLELVGVIEDGALRLEEAKSHGPDLKLDAVGSVNLRQPLQRSDLNMMVRVKIEDAYMSRSPKVATMFELASSGLKAALTPDGAIQYSLVGPMGSRLRARPAGSQEFEAPK
jgi:type II secretion system protein N